MPIKTSPKDFFLHLGATIALYASVMALITLAFTIINKAFPDNLSNYFDVSQFIWPISILIVLVPILYVLEWLVDRDIANIPEKRDIGIRKIRMYMTMFLTGATIAVSIIILINIYLRGEITDRFIFKVAVCILVSAVVFTYYILAKADKPKQKGMRKIIASIGLIFAIGSIIGGFIIIGSPAKQRAIRFDSQRIDDLSSIQYGISNYMQSGSALPTSFEDLKNKNVYFSSTVDPETKIPYEYRVISPTKFELCATFSRPSLESDDGLRSRYEINNGSWQHDKGRECFEREVEITDRNTGKPLSAPIEVRIR